MENKIDITIALNQFASGNLSHNALNLFKVLGYNTSTIAPLSNNTFQEFRDTFVLSNPNFNENSASVNNWKYVDFLFRLNVDEISASIADFSTTKNNNVIIESYLFFVIDLVDKKDNEPYTRKELTDITREINKLFTIPAMIVFKHGDYITLSLINRRLNKRDKTKDVLEKVTLISDIDVLAPKRSHIEILFDLSLPELSSNNKISEFLDLHNAWQKALDTKGLNNRFFSELADWYFWASENVKFPDDIQLHKDKKKDEEIRNSTNLIRLITRVIFVWFIKEKKLVPDNLFQEHLLKNILKEFNKNKKSSTYYSTILQNLFFGTLNQKMDLRGFVKDNDRTYYKEDYGIKNLYRFAENFAITEKEALKLFENIPFLNGGLFDCLDKPGENKKIVYVDGFSRNKKKQSIVPDYLFFEKTPTKVDLTSYYDPEAKKPIIKEVKSLFEILNDYKFTVEENTPLIEEVALDPELLGKVFENLLAYYNPETQKTARKQTGSFYTPREIVSYMVDESLVAYLKTQMLDDNPAWLEFGKQQADMFGNTIREGQLKIEQSLSKSKWKDKEDELEEKLRDLVSYSNTEHLFTDDEDVLHLIYAIDHCKILDPACGSGAFPMGVLHKLTYILSKLDRDNEKWKAVQKRNAQREIDEALNVEDKKAREKKLIDINEAFTYNSSDYARKLYLIENCIYGVDIQPIAVQISKLRFFISLIVEQTERTKAENRGILPLPNLETKFVAANTLIGLDKPEGLDLRNDKIKILEQKLAENRHKHFGTKSKKEKDALQAEDKKIRESIASIIKDEYDELQKQINDKIKVEKEKLKQSKAGKHKPADATKHAKALKALEKKIAGLESLLVGNKGIDDLANKIASFDLYDQNKSADWFEPEWMFGVTCGFDIIIGNPPYKRVDPADAGYSFYNLNYKTSKGGKSNLYKLFYENSFEFIKSNGFLSFITPNTFLSSTDSLELRKILLSKRILQLIEYSEKDKIFENVTQAVVVSVIGNLPLSNNKLFIKTEKQGSNYIIQNSIYENEQLVFQPLNSAILKIRQKTKRLSDYVESYQGEINLTFKKDFYSTKKTLGSLPMWRGDNVGKWHEAKPTLEFCKLEADDRKHYKYKRVITQQVSNQSQKFRTKAFISEVNYLCGNSTNYSFPIKDNNMNIYFILGLFNSNLFNYYFNYFSSTNHITVKEINRFPIDDSYKSINDDVSECVINIIKAKHKDINADISIYERQIDDLVYKLYELTPEEIEIIKSSTKNNEDESKGDELHIGETKNWATKEYPKYFNVTYSNLPLPPKQYILEFGGILNLDGKRIKPTKLQWDNLKKILNTHSVYTGIQNIHIMDGSSIHIEILFAGKTIHSSGEIKEGAQAILDWLFSL